MDLAGPLSKLAKGHEYIIMYIHFVSKLMSDLCWLLQVRQIRMSVYHVQTDGLVKRFNQTSKRMLRQVVDEDERTWDLLLPYVLFLVYKTPQAYTGFTPFELLFGKTTRGLLDLAKEAKNWGN